MRVACGSFPAPSDRRRNWLPRTGRRSTSRPPCSSCWPLSQGHGVSVLPLHRQLTTTEAAQLLSASRPHVILLLERGDLPFEKVGTHRRVRLADVLAYRHVQDQRRQEALANIVRQGEDLNLAY